MKIKVFGFTWERTDKKKIEDFLGYVKSLNVVEVQNLDKIQIDGNYHRITIAAPLEDKLWGGFLLTVKNVRKFIRSSKSPKGNGYKISTGEIEKGAKFADINFFLLNPQNGAGLYEYYHLSGHLNTFNLTFAGKFKQYCSINELKGNLKYSAYLTPTDFKERVKNLHSVHHIDYELSTIAVPDARAIPASGFVNRQRIKVFYERKFQNSSLLRDQINSFLDSHSGKISKFFLKGKSEDGEDVHCSLFDDPSIFSENEFNDFNVDLEIDESIEASLKTSENLKQLVRISKRTDVKDFFYTPVKS